MIGQDINIERTSLFHFNASDFKSLACSGLRYCAIFGIGSEKQSSTWVRQLAHCSLVSSETLDNRSATNSFAREKMESVILVGNVNCNLE